MSAFTDPEANHTHPLPNSGRPAQPAPPGPPSESRIAVPPPPRVFALEPDLRELKGRTTDGTPWICQDPGGDWVTAAQRRSDGAWLVALLRKDEPHRVRLLAEGLSEREAVRTARAAARALFYAGAALIEAELSF